MIRMVICALVTLSFMNVVVACSRMTIEPVVMTPSIPVSPDKKVDANEGS